MGVLQYGSFSGYRVAVGGGIGSVMTGKIGRGLRLGVMSLGIAAGAVKSKYFSSFKPSAPTFSKEDNSTISFVSYSIIPWYGVWQRPQQFATRFSSHYSGIYLDPVGLQHLLSKNTPEELHRYSDTLKIFCPRVLPMGKTRSSVIRLNDALVLDKTDKLMKHNRMENPILITNTPLADEIAQKYPWRAVVYDVIDDFINCSWAPHDAEQREQRLFRKADTVFTGTHSLWKKKQHFHSDVEFIPCGVEVDHFIKANNYDLALPDDIRDIKKRGPVIGYFGALNERIDANLLIRIAELIPDASIFLIGPIFADFGLSDFEDKWASVLPTPDSPGFGLKKMPSNIHIAGIRNYRDLPAYLKAFDVCLLPYVLSDATYDIHPVKGLEYLASGRPVVSTPLPDVVAFYEGIIDVADTGTAFAEKVLWHLNNPDQQKAYERIEFARPKTWDNMADRMRRKILSVCGMEE
jgi:glycosyltransferase involved in cell wall biosynthesis